MSSNAIPANPLTLAEAPARTDPVVPPKKGFGKLLREIFEHGGPGYLQFAITNICNSDLRACIPTNGCLTGTETANALSQFG